jgi:LysM repeat protein
MRYRGTGVAMSTASHRRRPVSVLTTVGLALLAGVITLWLGLMANFGSVLNGEPAEASAQVPAALAVVRVEPGESLQQLAARVAPGAPVRDVVERIRNLNALDSNSVAAGQTLIAPIG